MRVLFFLFLTAAACAQNKSLIKSDSVYWFGVDFTKAKFMGGFADEMEMEPKAAAVELINNQIHRWNDLFFKEPLHYNIKEALKKNYFFADAYYVNRINNTINPDSVFYESKMPYKWANPDQVISSCISKYTSEEFKSGLGLCFVVEYFNKKAAEASVYTVFFDIADKKVIGYRKLKGIPKGIGIRNYWAGAIKNIINQLGSSAYPGIVWQLKQK